MRTSVGLSDAERGVFRPLKRGWRPNDCEGGAIVSVISETPTRVRAGPLGPARTGGGKGAPLLELRTLHRQCRSEAWLATSRLTSRDPTGGERGLLKLVHINSNMTSTRTCHQRKHDIAFDDSIDE